MDQGFSCIAVCTMPAMTGTAILLTIAVAVLTK